jgi:cell division protein FtsQ
VSASSRTRASSTRTPARRPSARPATTRSSTRTPWKRSALRPTLTKRQQVYTAIVVVLLVIVGLVVWFTPLMSVRQVQVRGVSTVSQDQVRGALDVPAGTPLLRVDLGAAAARVAALPRVAHATVDRHYPSGLTVSVTERVPTVFVDKPDGTHLLDATGFDFATTPPAPGLPRLVVANPGPRDALTGAALAVLGALPGPVRTQVEQVVPASPADVRLTLVGGRTVLWGSPVDLQHKGAVLAALLTQPGRVYDVSSPGLPTIS